MTHNLLLHSDTAKRLYHEVAAHQPIIDCHTHLDPQRLATRHRFANLSEAWLNGDHYKWRAMRAAGVPEQLASGTSDPHERYLAWAATLPLALRSPLYDWARLELAQLGISEILTPATAPQIWTAANAALALPGRDAAGLLELCGYTVVCTTDDPCDDLRWHTQSRTADLTLRMYPTWRPDAALGVQNPVTWNAWVDRLAQAAGQTIATRDDLVAALAQRRQHFAAHGCKLSDHGLDRIWSDEWSEAQVAASVVRLRRGEALSEADIDAFRAWFLDAEARADHALGWVSQLHLGALRNVNTRLRGRLGADAGCDSIGDEFRIKDLARYLDRLDQAKTLPATILYNLNASDGEPMACLAACFRNIQYGAAWWFHDHKRGMRRHLDIVSDYNLLGRWVGMLSDSRSFLSGSRHDYFRRVLCEMLGHDAERGTIPAAALDTLVIDLCHGNANRLFAFGS